MFKHNFEAHSCNHCWRGKAISITHSEGGSVVRVIEHAVCMHCIILSSVMCLAVPYFPHYLINGTISRKSY